MNAKEFSKRVSDICNEIKQNYDGKLEDIRQELRERNIRSPFVYAAWCEANFEANLREDYKRRTTMTSDFSLAEAYLPLSGIKAITDTLKNPLNSWRDDIKFMAEMVMVVNMKSWEHHARGNAMYSRMYADMYYAVKDLYFDWFEGNDEAFRYYMDFID